ncbi:MAG: PEP-CTERM sorting domain-containing protein [Acidobacteriaceae bacterium]|nr:PEP-CTERM sorting domain-containing protein [Acidobacteriaceae bacterium]
MKALLCAVFLVTAPAAFADIATSVKLRVLLAGREKFQHWFFKSFLALAGCCFLSCRLLADPLPTLTATSASAGGPVSCTPAACTTLISASGDSFTLGGRSYGGVNFNEFPALLFPNSAGFDVSGTVLAGPGSPPYFVTGEFEGTSVDYYGNATVMGAFPYFLSCPSPETTHGCLDSSIITVSAEGGAITASPITPSSPSTSIILPATMVGSFSACDARVPPLFFCTNSSPVIGNVSINLPGQVAVHLDAFYFNGTIDFIRVTEKDFVSTPEPASILLLALGLVAVSAIVLRRKFRPICDMAVSNSNSSVS